MPFGSNPSEFAPAGKGKDKIGVQDTSEYPVECVNWDDARGFVRRVSGFLIKGSCELPTEAEWEYAYRAGTMNLYIFTGGEGAFVGDGNCADASLARAEVGKGGARWDDGWPFTAPVGRFKPNAFGLYDMGGNVWEWCRDGYGPYTELPRTDPVQLAVRNNERVRRGGSWATGVDACRATVRVGQNHVSRGSDQGFRLHVSLD